MSAGDCEPLIIGDFQSFPEKIYDNYNRANPKRNPLSKILSTFIRQNNLKLIDITNGSGPIVTYNHCTLNNSSYIDHIAVFEDSDLELSNCKVHELNPLNVSDHVPVSIVMETSNVTLDDVINEELPNTFLPKHYWKDANFLTNYKEIIRKNLNVSCENTNSESSLMDMFNILTDSATQAASATYYNNKDRWVFSKSWWTPELSKAKSILSTHFKIWKAAGFLKDEGIIHNRYLLARKNFRKEVKNAQNKNTINKYIQIDKLKYTQPQNFWNKMKSMRKMGSKRTYTINGKQSSPDISNEFADHFSTLLNQPKVPVNVNKVNLSSRNLDEEEPFVISSNDVEAAINLIKRNKSPDSFNLVAEHLIYAENETIKIWLCNLFNQIFDEGHTPSLLSTSKMVPLAKSLKKSLKDAGNYRGISIIPILTKLLEYIIILKCPEIAQSHHLQFGFKSNSSTLHAEFIISETVKYYNHKKSPVFMCSLDAEKAFDTCNWDILFTKLIKEKHIPLRVVKVLSSLYEKGTAKVNYNGHTSENFTISQGVRQGSILSPYLYNIYTELLLKELELNCNVGTSLFEKFTGIVAYADDIVLLSTTISGLQNLVDKCLSYSEQHGVALNAEKTEFMISGSSDNDKEYLILNHCFIRPTEYFKHLGFLWNIGNKRQHHATVENENITERLNKFWTIIHSLIRAGIRFCAPKTTVQLFKSIAIPTLTYGLELCTLKKSTITKLNSEGRSALKLLFNISKYSKNHLNKLFKIADISTIIQQNKLNLLTRLLCNDFTREICLNMFTETQNYDSFTNDVLETTRTLNIDLFSLIYNRQCPHINPIYHDIPEYIEDRLNFCIQFWQIKPLREYFKSILEERVLRREQET